MRQIENTFCLVITRTSLIEKKMQLVKNMDTKSLKCAFVFYRHFYKGLALCRQHGNIVCFQQTFSKQHLGFFRNPRTLSKLKWQVDNWIVFADGIRKQKILSTPTIHWSSTTKISKSMWPLEGILGFFFKSGKTCKMAVSLVLLQLPKCIPARVKSKIQIGSVF